MKYDSKKRLYFVHVPKTAGSAVRIFLREMGFPKENCWFPGHEEPLQDKHRLIYTHFSRMEGRGIETFDDADQMLLWLREPSEIYISFYFYWVQHWLKNGSVMNVQGKAYVGKPKGVLDFVENFEIDLMDYLPVDPVPDMFLFTGFADLMQPSFDKLSKILRLPSVNTNRRHNWTTWNEEFDREAVDAIVRERNPEFVDFYGECRKHWLPIIGA